MNIIILGAGKVGQVLCDDLSNENHDITLIESDPDRFEDVLNKYDINGVLGNGASLSVQIEANVKNADVFLAVTENDELNMIACVLAKQLGAKETLARARNTDYIDVNEIMTHKLGINQLINPEYLAAQHCLELLEFPLADSFETLHNSQAPIVELTVSEHAQFKQKSLIQFRNQYPNVIICVVTNNFGTFIPKGDYIVSQGDKIYVTGPVEELIRLYKENGQENNKINSVLIIGGGLVSQYVMKLFENSRIDIKLMEIDPQKAGILAERYPHVEVICADGTNITDLKEQGAADYDAILAFTGIDEENIIINMVAKEMGIPKRLTKINRTELIEIVKQVGLQSIITPKRIIADKIIQYVRALDNSQGSNVEALYTMANEEVEALLFKVKEDSQVVGVALKDLKLKENILIAYIIRHNVVIFPTGQDSLLANDKLVLISANHQLRDLDEIIA